MRVDDPYPEAKSVEDAPPQGVEATELIVHGVGGAPPSDVLDDFHPLRVSGDHLAGFYHPHQPPDRDDPDLPPAAFPREAFAWGGLTSGDASRALWFLLLPFALMNTAGWMHPDFRGGRARGLVKGVVRLLAALGTVMAVMMFAQLSLDLVGYQCGWRVEACRDTHWWLSFLDGELFAGYPSRILALAAAVPLAGLVLWWGAGLVSFRRFEEYLVTEEPDDEGPHPEPGDHDQTEEETGWAPAEPPPPVSAEDLSTDPDIGLDDPSFWEGMHAVRRLRRLHFQLGVASIGVTLAVVVAELTWDGWGLWPKLTVWGGVATILVLLGAIAHPKAAVTAKGGFVDDEGFRLGGWIFAGGVLVSAVLYSVSGVGVVIRADVASPRLDGMIPPFTVLTVAQFMLGLVLLAVLLLAKRPNRGSFLRVGPVIGMALGWFMIIAVWAGTGLRLADWFGPSEADVPRFWNDTASECASDAFCYPIWYEDAAVAFTAVLLVAAVGILTALRWWPRQDDIEGVDRDFAPRSTDGERRRVKAVARKHRHARIVSRADGWVAGGVLLAVVAFMVVGFTQVEDGWRFPSPIVTFSSWVVALVPIAAVLVVRLGLKNPSARRGIGTVFDILTFFPRRVHPFAPPCYGERAVPQLRWRIGWLDQSDRGVVLRAHSQGTVISAAALLEGVERPHRVRFLTYGSPLVMLYQHHFPAYFGNVVPRVGASLGGDDTDRWVHMCARTDPLGCRLVPDGEVPWLTQVRVLDPETWTPRLQGDPPPPSLGHSTYHRHRALQAWVEHLLRRSIDRPSAPPPRALDLDDACV